MAASPPEPPPEGPASPTGTRSAGARANQRVVLVCLSVLAVMVGLVAEAPTFYRAFCAATGFNGAVKRAAYAPSQVSAQTVVVKFDTNVNGVPFQFQPEQASQTVHLGASNLAFFRVKNTSDHPVTARALFNVVPEAAGQYFSKLECFCFSDQTLAPGQTAEFPVVYYVDPRFGQDRDTRYEPDITLSYTFFPATDAGKAAPAQTKPQATASQARAAPAAGPLGGTAKAGL
ncbi:MAG: cytochrome c oxidase assembly protein [Alphaproteobacteria bacterium]|nr:cytochrome c oxidase assembly protein [Alphaproteobacteria bacterium]